MFRLCLALGIDHPDGIEERLTTPQVVGWWKYFDAEPWGADRDDMRAEIQRVRALMGDESPFKWEFPYIDAQQIVEMSETPREFNDRMKRIAAEIESKRAKGATIDGSSRNAQPESIGEYDGGADRPTVGVSSCL